uniref:(California timema) hypothetical protein n=1 Tax=Timema californicum TaxID=61474 RepID=A0A7R9J7X9_TIMCA|nr:unnamed protein product [Timema californicum]
MRLMRLLQGYQKASFELFFSAREGNHPLLFGGRELSFPKMDVWQVFGWLVVIFLLLLLVLYALGTHNHDYFSRRKLRFIRPTPLLGNMAPYAFQKVTFARLLADLYDGLKGCNIGGMFEFIHPRYLVLDPALIRTMFVKDADFFTDHEHPFTEHSEPVFGKSVFSLEEVNCELSVSTKEAMGLLYTNNLPVEQWCLNSKNPGDKWKNMRHILSPAYTSSKLKSMFSLLAECETQMMDHLKARSDGRVRLEIRDLMSRFTNDTLATTSFGFQMNSFKKTHERYFENSRDLTRFHGIRNLIFLAFMFTPGFAKFIHEVKSHDNDSVLKQQISPVADILAWRNCQVGSSESGNSRTFLRLRIIPSEIIGFLRSLIVDHVTKREKENTSRPDMLQLLIDTRKKQLRQSSEGQADGLEPPPTPTPNPKYQHSPNSPLSNFSALSDDDIVAQALVFIFGGLETTSTVLTFACYELALHQDVQKRLAAEIDASLGVDGGKLTYETTQNIPYLDTVISETLRLYPPAAFVDRSCVKPYVIPASGDNPEVHLKKGDRLWVSVPGLHYDPDYFPEPDKFDPERFSEENKDNITPFTFVPFGVGPRTCLGKKCVQGHPGSTLSLPGRALL